MVKILKIILGGGEPPEELPLSLENLSKVTSVVRLKKSDKTALLVEHEPGSGKNYQILNLFDDAGSDLDNVGDGGVKALVKVIEAIWGEEFVLVVDNEETIHYRWKGLHDKALNFEKARIELIEWLKSRKDKDKKTLIYGNRTFSAVEMAQEVENETEIGIDHIKTMIEMRS